MTTTQRGITVAPRDDDLPRLFTLAEVMDALSISRNTALRLIESGELPATRVGGQYRFLASEIMAYLESQRVKPAHER